MASMDHSWNTIFPLQTMSFYVPFQWKATPQAVPVLSRWMSGSQINEGPSLVATLMTPYRRSKGFGPQKKTPTCWGHCPWRWRRAFCDARLIVFDANYIYIYGFCPEMKGPKVDLRIVQLFKMVNRPLYEAVEWDYIDFCFWCTERLLGRDGGSYLL